MSYWKPEFWPVLLGCPEGGNAIIREVLRTADRPCHLIAWQEKIPLSLRLAPHLCCRYLNVQHAIFTCDWLKRLAATRPETMPCLCAMSEMARVFMQSHRESLAPYFLMFDTPQDLLAALRAAQ